MNHSSVIVTEVRSRRDVTHFIDLPYRIYAGDRNWIAPLRGDARKLLDRRRNPFFDHGEAAFWLAWRGGVPVGRISAQVNRLHLDIHADSTGHFGFLEAIDDGEVFRALTQVAEAWLRDKGLTRLIGPCSLSINDEVGVLVEGFDFPPMVGMGYSPRYYAERLESVGYCKIKDLRCYSFDLASLTNEVLAPFVAARTRFGEAHGIRARPIDMRNFKSEMKRGLALYNDAWSENWGFVPITEREADDLIAKVRFVTRPEAVAFGEINGELQAIEVALPNINELIFDLGGRLFPFGWAKILWRLHRRPPTSIRIILVGVAKQLRASHGAGALLRAGALLAATSLQLVEAGRKAGLSTVDLSWILEDNEASLALARVAPRRRPRTYRLYTKEIY